MTDQNPDGPAALVRDEIGVVLKRETASECRTEFCFDAHGGDRSKIAPEIFTKFLPVASAQRHE
jgi:hypothetical protein